MVTAFGVAVVYRYFRFFYLRITVMRKLVLSCCAAFSNCSGNFVFIIGHTAIKKPLVFLPAQFVEAAAVPQLAFVVLRTIDYIVNSHLQVFLLNKRLLY